MAACIPLPLNRSSSRKCFAGGDSLRERSNGRYSHDDQKVGKSERGVNDRLGDNLSAFLPKKLVRSVSLKLRRLSLKFDQEEGEELVGVDPILWEDEQTRDRNKWSSGKCLGFYPNNGRCRVGDDVGILGRDDSGVGKLVVAGCGSVVDDDEFYTKKEPNRCFDLEAGLERFKSRSRNTNSSGYQGVKDRRKLDHAKMVDHMREESLAEKRGKSMGAFSRSTTERLRRRGKSAEKCPMRSKNEEKITALPDDIVEMCLARASFQTLLNARMVCKKWKAMISSTHFMNLRASCSSQKPWLFVFGLSRDGICIGQIQALDTSTNKWHKIDADVLRGRFMFSVAAVGSSIYVVGGCSTMNNFLKMDRSSYKKHKAVFVYSPLNGSWKKVAPMKTARVMPVVSVFEIQHGSRTIHGHSRKNGDVEMYSEFRGANKLLNFQGRYSDSAEASTSRCLETIKNGNSGVYDGPQKTYTGRQLWEVFQESSIAESSSLTLGLGRNSCGRMYQEEREIDMSKDTKLYGLIVAGGQGLWDEPLDSVEIYDPVINKWREITRLPADHGFICAGAVCNGSFYIYSETDRLSAYDFEKGTWKEIQIHNSLIRLPEYVPKLVVCRDRLFMLCVSWSAREDNAYGNDKATRKMLELDLNTHSWTELSKHPDAPLDWNAAFVGYRDMIFGLELFKIFGQVLDFVTVCDVSYANVEWNRISRNNVAQDMDASSCMTKAVAILPL